VPDGPRLVTVSGLPSHEVTAPCRVLTLKTLAPLLLRRSPHTLYLRRLGFRVFTFQIPEKLRLHNSRDPLMGFGSSSEATQAPSRCLEPSVSQELDVQFHPDAN
jgi:hypothetical protein